MSKKISANQHITRSMPVSSYIWFRCFLLDEKADVRQTTILSLWDVRPWLASILQSSVFLVC